MTMVGEAASGTAMSEQSQVPHKMSDSDMKVRLEQTQKELSEVKNENVNNAKKLQKERQKVQNLLSELKLSQENLQKVKLTFVPQENVNELESSVKQLQDTISGHESQGAEHRKTIEELKMTVYELQRISEESQSKAGPDYSNFMATFNQKISGVMMG